MTAGVGYADHPKAWPMTSTRPSDLAVGFEGRCACRWAGPWRATAAEAEADIDRHLAEVGADPARVARQPEGG